jgi:hypothetical protein
MDMSNNWSFLQHLILETKIAHHTTACPANELVDCVGVEWKEIWVRVVGGEELYLAF